MKVKKNIKHIIVFLSIFLIVLNPYTIYGRPGIIISFAFIMYLFYIKKTLALIKPFFLPFVILFAISLLGVASSVLHDIPQFNHPYSVFSLLSIFISVTGIWVYCQRNNIYTETIILFIFATLVLNAVIILLQLSFDEFRAFIESFLTEAGNINYTEGFRYRGLSASGGAGLSITLPVALILSLFLFQEKKLNLITLLVTMVILFSSGLVIGRTGLLILPIGALIYIVLTYKKSLSISIAINYFFFIALLTMLSISYYELISNWLTNKFGDGFMNYAFDFMLEGKEGLEKEGTTSMIIEFLGVLPLEFPEALIGYGFYGGSAFYPWTDSGYSRMFLSVGFPFGIIFYLVVFYLFVSGYRNSKYKYLLISILAILLISEAKEPLLISGNASRIFLIILIFSKLDTYSKKVKSI